MRKWEYKSILGHLTNHGLDFNISELGVEGWEFISAMPRTMTLTLPELAMKPVLGSTKIVSERGALLGSGECLFLFKRPV